MTAQNERNLIARLVDIEQKATTVTAAAIRSDLLFESFFNAIHKALDTLGNTKITECYLYLNINKMFPNDNENDENRSTDFHNHLQSLNERCIQLKCCYMDMAGGCEITTNAADCLTDASDDFMRLKRQSENNNLVQSPTPSKLVYLISNVVKLNCHDHIYTKALTDIYYLIRSIAMTKGLYFGSSSSSTKLGRELVELRPTYASPTYDIDKILSSLFPFQIQSIDYVDYAADLRVTKKVLDANRKEILEQNIKSTCISLTGDLNLGPSDRQKALAALRNEISRLRTVCHLVVVNVGKDLITNFNDMLKLGIEPDEVLDGSRPFYVQLLSSILFS